MEFAEGFGQRLRRLRLERNMTQVELAGKYSSAYVSMIERGGKLPSPAAAREFADRLGVTVNELALGVPPNFEAELATRMQEAWRSLYLGRYESAELAFATAEHEAREYGFAVLQAKALVGRARSAERQGQTGKAMDLFRSALELFRDHAPAPSAVEAVAGIARCHQMAGSVTSALVVLEQYLAELDRKNLGEPAALMRVHASLVWPYCELGVRHKAVESAHRALQLQAKVENPEEIAAMHLNVARALLDEGRADMALDSLTKAEAIFRDLDWQTELARAQVARGIVLVAKDQLCQARDEIRAALQTFRAVGFSRDEGRALNELARVERLLGNDVAAENFARQALELLAEMEAAPELALAHRELGLCLRERDREAAERHFREAAELYDTCGEVIHAAHVYRLLGDLLDPLDPEAGKDAYRTGLDLIAQALEGQ